MVESVNPGKVLASIGLKAAAMMASLSSSLDIVKIEASYK